MRRLRSLTFRMVASHIIVASLTSIIVWLMIILAQISFQPNLEPANYQSFAILELASWLGQTPDGQPNALGLPAGFGLMISPDNTTVLHSYGDTRCRAGAKLAECAPEVVNSPVGQRFLQINGEQWGEVVLLARTGERALIRYGPPHSELGISLPVIGLVYGNGPFILVTGIVTLILSIPIALALAWLSARPMTRRLRAIARVSQRFAAGHLEERVQDRKPDEVGELGRQFDDMAATLEQNVVVLRELAQRNAELARQAEQAAIQAERVRLSRDLHDDIAQHLFSLSVSTAALPDLIERDPTQAVQQARGVANLAEQTLLDLRGLLIELRPSSVIERGLSEALQTLCLEWQNTRRIPVECSVVLTGQHLPAGVEDVVYRVAQEALNNIAKHAQARSVHVSLVEGRSQITLSTTDDGKGFDRAIAASNGKFGLISMRERAHSVGGNLIIESDTSMGTTLRLTLPLPRNGN